MTEQKTTEQVIEACRQDERLRAAAYVVGKWVWASFEAKPDEQTRAALKALGFRWNKARKTWQNPCGHFTRRAKGYDPRDKYGIQEL